MVYWYDENFKFVNVNAGNARYVLARKFWRHVPLARIPSPTYTTGCSSRKDLPEYIAVRSFVRSISVDVVATS